MRFFLFILWLLHWLPLPVLGRLGKCLGTVCYYMMKNRRHIALTNLRLCFPDIPEKERRKIAREHFQGYGRSILERGRESKNSFMSNPPSLSMTHRLARSFFCVPISSVLKCQVPSSRWVPPAVQSIPNRKTAFSMKCYARGECVSMTRFSFSPVARESNRLFAHCTRISRF